jgi:hypothetical protein
MALREAERDRTQVEAFDDRTRAAQGQMAIRRIKQASRQRKRAERQQREASKRVVIGTILGATGAIGGFLAGGISGAKQGMQAAEAMTGMINEGQPGA